ncbi:MULTISPECIES: DUF2335 domain-containing protein [unclassified Imperialibacter]|uniref:DUF2335 domain-containing protein n=1 Tax=unclassified Imperialibacter TaxID=2629706 RepID=UPI001254EB00|nr:MULTISPECIES: DUF2335 domain-containing protein [unclassified Imperialibacter]CAD5285282.1 conserved hypothetical protein [Imperialibacter sp. 75]CAD5296953.1 conserved hypothetical protein [Imperialibacter sp. 89]VVT23958.1 conserved hypothetical protein [Imperialibacter sp. EC-SDR9]
MAKKVDSELITKQIRQQFPKLGGNEARKIVQIVSQQVSIRTGPYPSPEDYDYYNEIDPDLTGQMKRMVLEEQKHQHNLDEKHLDKDFLLRRTGQVFAFILCMIALIGGFYTVLQGFEIGGAIIGAVGLAGIVGQFLRRR